MKRAGQTRAEALQQPGSRTLTLRVVPLGAGGEICFGVHVLTEPRNLPDPGGGSGGFSPCSWFRLIGRLRARRRWRQVLERRGGVPAGSGPTLPTPSRPSPPARSPPHSDARGVQVQRTAFSTRRRNRTQTGAFEERLRSGLSGGYAPERVGEVATRICRRSSLRFM